MEIIKMWYRSTLKDGTLWCESSDPEEVVEQSKGQEVIFQKLEVFKFTTPWKNWKPEELE